MKQLRVLAAAKGTDNKLVGNQKVEYKNYR